MIRYHRLQAVTVVALSASIGATPVSAQADVAAAIAELKAENAKLAARIAELEKQVGAQPVEVRTTVPEGSVPAARTITPALTPGNAAQSRLTTAGSPPTLTRDVEAKVPPAPLDRPLQGGGVGLQLNASSAGGQVAIAFGRSVRKTDVAYDEVSATGTSWTVTASAPVDKKGGDTSIATLDSFTDSSSLKVNLTRLHLTLHNLLTDPDYIALREEATAECVRVAAGAAAKLACQTAQVDEEFIRTWLPTKVRRYDEVVENQRSAWGFGIEGTVGYRHYSYIDTATLAKGTSDKVPWGVRAFGVWLPSTDLAFTAGAGYQRGFDEKTAAIACPATTTGTSLICATGPDGQPTRKNKVLLSLEGRKLFDLSQTSLQNGVVDRFAIAPQFTWDARNKDVGFDFPIYLVPDDKGNLIGGLRLGYKSGDTGFIGGVFVGAAFDLFKR